MYDINIVFIFQKQALSLEHMVPLSSHTFVSNIFTTVTAYVMRMCQDFIIC